MLWSTPRKHVPLLLINTRFFRIKHLVLKAFRKSYYKGNGRKNLLRVVARPTGLLFARP